MNERLYNILLSPFFISLVITITIIFFLPGLFNKYQLKVQEKFHLQTNAEKDYVQHIYYNDLDENGESERIDVGINVLGNAFVIIREGNSNVIDQWNFRGSFLEEHHTLGFHDINNDGIKEVYCLSVVNDTLILNQVLPYKNNPEPNEYMLVPDIGYQNQLDDIVCSQLDAYDLDGDGLSEIIFGLTGGYHSDQRYVYSYSIKNRHLQRSPFLCNGVKQISYRDLNGDEKPELFLDLNSYLNINKEKLAICSDSFTYQVILNHKLEYFLPPQEIEVPFSKLKFILPENTFDKFITFISSSRDSLLHDQIRIYNKDGKLQKKTVLSPGNYGLVKTTHPTSHFYLTNLIPPSREVQKFDNYLNKLTSFTFSDLDIIFSFDIDGTGNREILTINENRNTLTVYQDDFRHPASVKINKVINSPKVFGRKVTKSGPHEFYIRFDDRITIFSYAETFIYPFRYLIYFLLYFPVLGLVFSIQSTQKIRERKRRQLEEEMAALQIKTIKNQVDPHFVFNAVNTMSALMLEDDKETADRFIIRFSELMRQTLRSSDKITTPLSQELEFVENYIKVQQIRFENNFNYRLIVDSSIDKQQQVPKHVIFTYIENAIKHGLATNDGVGELTIQIMGNKPLEIIIENSVPSEDQQHKTVSTGSGLKIMEQIFKLYYKIYKRKIKQEMNDIRDAEGSVKFKRIMVTIY